VEPLDFSHLYTTKIEKNFDDDQAYIIETFRDLLKQGKTVIKLLNYYQGLPLCFPATIVSIEHDIIDLDINPQQAVAIERDHHTFIRCDAFKHDICAHVQYVNVLKRAAALKKFFFVEIMAEQRNTIRLVMDPPAEALFEVGGTKVNGSLIDISMSGAAVRVEHLPECGEGFETTLQIKLPNIIQNSYEISLVPARHVATKDRDNSYLFIFSITPDQVLEQHISKYIFQRQVEIIRDLKDASI
jgi:hypothetical protein